MRKNKKAIYSTVMLVDDNEIDNFINEQMLKGCGFSHKIYVNTGAKSALEFLKNLKLLENQANAIPEIIFLDINMPLMDGFTFIEEFEKIKFNDRFPKIVFLTSSINPDDEVRSKKYPQVVSFIRKPLNEKSLQKLVEVKSDMDKIQ